MLWLSGLMALLAVGAFSLLWFLPMKPKAAEEEFESETDDDPLLMLGQDATAAEAAGTAEDDDGGAEDGEETGFGASEEPPADDMFEDLYAQLAMQADDDEPDGRDLAGADEAGESPEAGEETGYVWETLFEQADEPDEEDSFEELYAQLRVQMDGDMTDGPDLSEDDVATEDATVTATADDIEMDVSEDEDGTEPDVAVAAAAEDADTDEADVGDRELAEADPDWFAAAAGTAEFEDFDPQEDDLVVVWDDSTGPEPSVEVVRDEADPTLARVLMGDVILAEFRSKAEIGRDEVSMVPLSAARSLGWAHP